MKTPTTPSVVALVALVVCAVLAVGGCTTTKKARRGLGKRAQRDDNGVVGANDAGAKEGGAKEVFVPPPKLVDKDAAVDFDVGGAVVSLGAHVVAPEGVTGPVVVIVPGGGDVGKDGTRKGDGVVVYKVPVDTSVVWGRALAERGAIVFTYDKRTCGPNDVESCKKNPQSDLDAEGPVALAKDVDAACAAAKAAAGDAFDGRLILWAHGQAAQVALSSSCANDAAALVLLSPVPRAIDAVLVDALADRQRAAERNKNVDEAARLKNLAGTRAAGFAAMKGGKFAKDARVDGATVAFWQGWIALTQKTEALLAPVKDKVVVVVGNGDLQLSAADRAAAQTLAAKKTVVVNADHHLLSDGSLDDDTVDAVAVAIDDVAGAPRS